MSLLIRFGYILLNYVFYSSYLISRIHILNVRSYGDDQLSIDEQTIAKSSYIYWEGGRLEARMSTSLDGRRYTTLKVYLIIKIEADMEYVSSLSVPLLVEQVDG